MKGLKLKNSKRLVLVGEDQLIDYFGELLPAYNVVDLDGFDKKSLRVWKDGKSIQTILFTKYNDDYYLFDSTAYDHTFDEVTKLIDS